MAGVQATGIWLRINDGFDYSKGEVVSGTLYFFCGKMGAGKSTRSRLVATEEKAVLISEDEWLSMLYPDQINTFDDYRRYSARLKPLVFSHVENLLRMGSNVVLDFPANTVGQRKWFSELVKTAGATGKLIYIKASDEICLKQIAIRRTEQPERAKFDTESVFNEVTRFFEEPGDSEGLDVLVIVEDVK